MNSFNSSMFAYSLILFFLISIMIKNISHFNRSQSECIKLVTSLQKKHRVFIKNLIRLNPLAKQLRLESKAAQRAIKAAPDPYSKAAATAWYTSVKLRQNTLRLSQIAIINSANQATLVFKAKGGLKNQNLTTEASIVETLYKEPESSLSPSYYLRANFKDLKVASSTTRFDSYEIKKKTINQEIKKSFTGEYKCKSTIKRESKTQMGEIAIVGDRHSLKQLVF